MSSFAGYSESVHNVFGLTDEQIKKYYFMAEKEDCGEFGYWQHIPMTNEDHNNPFFHRDTVVKLTNAYLFEQERLRKQPVEISQLMNEYNVLRVSLNNVKKELRKIDEQITEKLMEKIRNNFVSVVH